jgi:tryptophanyl-tRNA synthetase
MKKKILSGMRPTGKLHLGHLVGTLDNWVRLQDEYECYFMVADWHALMGDYENPRHMPEYIIDNVADWLSVGIDPQKAAIFIQSEVKEHLDLYAIFSCITPTYKEQMREVKTRDLHTYGFLGYPVLQAADILIYKAEKVPVGEDQLPHLELTREIGRRFNSLYGKNVFPDPEAILTRTPRLLGLDGRKMSKSYNNTIDLSDSEEAILAKVQTMFTDPKRIRLSDRGHPDSCNVFAYYELFVPNMKEEVRDWCSNAKTGCTECKKRLAAQLIDRLKPIIEKRRELLKDKDKILHILERGRKKAQEVTEQTLIETRKAIWPKS